MPDYPDPLTLFTVDVTSKVHLRPADALVKFFKKKFPGKTVHLTLVNPKTGEYSEQHTVEGVIELMLFFYTYPWSDKATLTVRVETPFNLGDIQSTRAEMEQLFVTFPDLPDYAPGKLRPRTDAEEQE